MNTEVIRKLPEFLSLIVPGQRIEIDSVFQFAGGVKQLEFFLDACTRQKCTVYFANEKLTVAPYGKRDAAIQYLSIARDQKLIKDYFRYLLLVDSGKITPFEK